MLKQDFHRAMTPAGGAFLACIGAVLAVGAFESSPVRYQLLGLGFIAGFAGLAATAIFTRFFRNERPAVHEVLLVWPPVFAQIMTLWAIGLYLPDERAIWLAALAVTGLHLLPMYWSFGPAIVILGLLCLSGAFVGFLFPGLPLASVIAADGGMKLVFGLMMFAGAFRSRDELAVS